MSFIRVRWTHADLRDPVLLYSELDPGRWEVRKVEIWADGHCGYAASDQEYGGTRLSKMPIPPLAEIANDKQFAPVEIDSVEFEEVWRGRESSLNYLLPDD